MDPILNNNQKTIDLFQLKKKIRELNDFQCEINTSCISIYVPPNKKIHELVAVCKSEESLCTSIKDSNNRKSIQTGLSTIRERIKVLSSFGQKGAIFFCSPMPADHSKPYVVEILDPPKTVSSFIFRCSPSFEINILEEMMQETNSYAFVISDGNGFLIAQLKNGEIKILSQKKESLPNKHNKGGQSSLRFSRLCEATRDALAKKTAEAIVNSLKNLEFSDLQGIILAGMSQIKNRVVKELDSLSSRFSKLIMANIDIAYTGIAGLRQAIQQSAPLLQAQKYFQEQELISQFLQEVSNDTKLAVYGPEHTLKALEEGNVKHLILYENSSLQKLTVINNNSNEEQIIFSHNAENEDDHIPLGKDLTKINQENLNEWITECILTSSTNVKITFVSNNTAAGRQFVKGFQGICGFLKFQFDYSSGDCNEEKEYRYEDEDEQFI